MIFFDMIPIGSEADVPVGADNEKGNPVDPQLFGCCRRDPCVRALIVGADRYHNDFFNDNGCEVLSADEVVNSRECFRVSR